MHIQTQLIHLGRETSPAVNSVSPPLVRTTTTLFPKLSSYKLSQRGQVFNSPRYGRSGTSTTFELQRAMAKLCNTQSCIATGSGLSAITAVLGTYASPGSHILVFAGVYGPARTFCDKVLVGSGTEIEYFSAGTDITELLRENTRLVFVETPASLTMEMVDVRYACEAAHSQGVPVACDSTWGTPLYFDSHGLGIDLSIHAATKFINGHSDVMMGLITGSEDAISNVRAHCDRIGTHVSPDACWSVLRGMRTLAVRLERHQASAIKIARWLQDQDAVQKVMFPALESDPGYKLWQQQFSGAAGPFTFQLTPCTEEAFERFVDGLELFGLGTSWGGFESLIMPAVPHHLRAQAVSDTTPRLVRLHIGLEDADDLRHDLERALKRLMY